MRKRKSVRDNGPDPADLYIGTRIRARRLEMDISQSELGQPSGITFQQVQKYENGKNRVSASRLIEFARALNCSPAYFFEGAPGVGKNANDATAGIYESVMRSSDGVELVRAFGAIENRAVRRNLMELTRSLATHL